MIESPDIPEVLLCQIDIHSILSKKLSFLLAPFVSESGVRLVVFAPVHKSRNTAEVELWDFRWKIYGISWNLSREANDSIGTTQGKWTTTP